ncbi:very short patch repair endonuclease [Streptomyces nigra]
MAHPMAKDAYSRTVGDGHSIGGTDDVPGGRRNTDSLPRDRAWRPRAGMTKAERDREQNRAAGGVTKRVVHSDGDDRAIATIVLTPRRRSGRVMASLQWTDAGQRHRRPLGEVTHPTRQANLRAAWSLAAETGLLVGDQEVAGSWASSPGTRASMLSNRGRDTKPELRLRSELHRAGLRYTVSARPVPSLRRTADVVFTKYKVAVFVDGCYWHGCPTHGLTPTQNRDFWVSKIEGNVKRDADTNLRLVDHGWFVVRVWEHTPTTDAVTLVRLGLAESKDGRAARVIRADVR